MPAFQYFKKVNSVVLFESRLLFGFVINFFFLIDHREGKGGKEGER